MSDTQGASAAGGEGEAPEAAAGEAADSRFLTPEGPKAGVRYPLQVVYCPEVDNLPLEYAEYHPDYEKAKDWMEANLTDDMRALYLAPGADGAAGAAPKKAQKRGGKGVMKTKKKQEVEHYVAVSRAPRGKKKSVTTVTGLGTYDIDLKVASKFFASRFACGTSVTGPDEIVIQGDVKDDLFDVIPQKWPKIDEDDIDDLGDIKR